MGRYVYDLKETSLNLLHFCHHYYNLTSILSRRINLLSSFKFPGWYCCCWSVLYIEVCTDSSWTLRLLFSPRKCLAMAVLLCCLYKDFRFHTVVVSCRICSYHPALTGNTNSKIHSQLCRYTAVMCWKMSSKCLLNERFSPNVAYSVMFYSRFKIYIL